MHAPGAGATSERGDARDGICPRRLHTCGCARVARGPRCGRFHAARLERKAIRSVDARAIHRRRRRFAPRRGVLLLRVLLLRAAARGRGRGGGGVHGARVRGAGGVSPRVRVRAAVRPSHARGDRRGARDGRQGRRPLRGSRQGPDLGPVAARRGVPVPALRGMRRVHVAGRIVRRAAGHEARAGAGRVAPNRKGFAAKRRLGGRFDGAMEKGRERALPARRVRARRPRPADAPRAVHGEVQEQDGVRFRGESPPRKRRERSRRAPRPAPAGRPRHRRRGHLPRRRRPRLPPAAPRGERRARKCTGAPADARGRGRGAPGVRPTDGRGRAEERHRARVESRKSGERSSFERASSRQV